MVIASQTCEPKEWTDENGRDQRWKKLGGLAAEWANPIDESKWFDKNIRFIMYLGGLITYPRVAVFLYCGFYSYCPIGLRATSMGTY